MEQVSKLNRNRSWLKEEDDKLRQQISAEPKQNWKTVAAKAGLKRTANSCRLRYVNHLNPRSRPGKLTAEEKLLTLQFRSRWGGRNCWSRIAKKLLPGRTDNDLKNFWHTLAKKPNREGRDANSEANRKMAELAETISSSGKFSMDYSPLISSDSYDVLKELFPHIAVAGGGAASEPADCSSIVIDGAVASVGCGFDVGTSPTSYNDLASSSAATDIGPDPGRVSYVDFSHTVTLQSHVALQQQLQKGFTAGFFHYGEYPSTVPGSDPVPAAEPGSTVTNNQGLSHMQVTSTDSVHVDTFINGPEFHAPVEQHEHLVFNGGFCDHGGGPIGFNKANVEAAFDTNEIDNDCSYGEEELGENKAFSDYFDFADFCNDG